ncbi:ArnT family glycosyltransferase [Deminuibacter soli]|nr:glycosyltransferase family 39 protein [Deminuibacter soli]
MKNGNRLILLLAIIKFILPYLLQHPVYEPHRDEFLYLAEGNHMAWGFMEVPPVLSVFAWLTKAFGNSIFWIKCWPSLFGALTFVLTARIAVSLGGKYFSILLCWLPFVLGGFLRVHYLFQPNAPEVFFWTLMAFNLIRYTETNARRFIYGFAIAAALGMLTKYSVAFYITALLGGLLLTRQTHIFKQRTFLWAALLGFLIFLPNLLWQYSNHFPVVFHMRQLRKTQLQYIAPSTFLIEQLTTHIPVFFVWMAGLWCTLFTAKGRQYRFIGVAYVIVLALLLAGHGKGYYALGAYPVLFAFGAWHLENFTAAKLKWLRYAMVVVTAALGYVLLPIALPMLPPKALAAHYEKHHTARYGVLRWEDLENHPLPQDFADMLGWEEMAQKSARAWQLLSDEEKKHTLFFCDNYGQAGAVNYYRRKYGLPEAFSDNASFVYWLPDSIHLTNVLLITDDKQEMRHPFIHDFQSAVAVDSVMNPYAREQGDLIILLKGANEPFNRFFAEKIRKAKAR